METRCLRPAPEATVPAVNGDVAEELRAEHLFYEAVWKHRGNDGVLGTVPRQRLELSVKVAGDVHGAGARRHSGAWQLRGVGGAGAIGDMPTRIGDPARQLLGHGDAPGRKDGVVQALAAVVVAER
jgi:hypothetical protein